jgi:hypothetical protein
MENRITRTFSQSKQEQNYILKIKIMYQINSLFYYIHLILLLLSFLIRTSTVYLYCWFSVYISVYSPGTKSYSNLKQVCYCIFGTRVGALEGDFVGDLEGDLEGKSVGARLEAGMKFIATVPEHSKEL